MSISIRFSKHLVSSMLTVLVVTPSVSMAEVSINRAEANCTDGSVCRIVPTLVPLKILPRPRSSIFAEPSMESEMLVPSVPALSPLFVFNREGVDVEDADGREGWYQVGAVDSAAVGWMRAQDVIEWHNSLILSYTAPGVDDEKRNRVLGFETIDDLAAIVDQEQRLDSASVIFDALELRDPEGPLPTEISTAGVVSAEPANVFTDIRDNFYMWPILSWAKPSYDPESDERFVEFVQLVPECRGLEESTSVAEGADSTGGTESAPVVSALAGEMRQEGAKVIDAVQVMFVVDTTGSMEPYIEAVKTGIGRAASAITTKSAQSVSFGFVGYQDSFDELDYVAKDFTADGFVDDEAFVALVDNEVRVEQWGDHLIPERLFEGVQTGLDGQWDSDALKFMVVITDAPGIPEGDGTPNGGTTVDETYVNMIKTDEAQFNLLADVSVADAERNGKIANDSNITMIVNHIKPGRFPELDELAGRQMEALVQTSGTEAGYMALDGAGGSNDEFEKVISATATLIAAAVGGTAEDISTTVADVESTLDSDSISDEVSVTLSTVSKAVKAAAMDYLGDAEAVECDYRGWTSDRDLADSAVRSLEVNTLLAHNQLDTLYRVLKDVHAALATGALTKAGFIESLQAVASSGLIDPNSIEAAKTGSLASSGLLPKWLETLPYQSAIASLSGDDINALTSAERTQLEINVNQKLQYYQLLISDNDRWFALSEADEDNLLKKVTPLPLEELP